MILKNERTLTENMSTETPVSKEAATIDATLAKYIDSQKNEVLRAQQLQQSLGEAQNNIQQLQGAILSLQQLKKDLGLDTAVQQDANSTDTAAAAE